MPVAKEQIRQIIADNNLNSVADVYSLLKDSFKDILQELYGIELSAEMVSFVFMDCIHYKVRISLNGSRLISTSIITLVPTRIFII